MMVEMVLAAVLSARLQAEDSVRNHLPSNHVCVEQRSQIEQYRNQLQELRQWVHPDDLPRYFKLVAEGDRLSWFWWHADRATRTPREYYRDSIDGPLRGPLDEAEMARRFVTPENWVRQQWPYTPWWNLP